MANHNGKEIIVYDGLPSLEGFRNWWKEKGEPVAVDFDYKTWAKIEGDIGPSDKSAEDFLGITIYRHM